MTANNSLNIMKLPRSYAQGIFSGRIIGSKIPPERKILRIHHQLNLGFLRRRIKQKFEKIFKNKKRLVVILIFLIAAGFIGWKFIGSRQQSPQYQTAQAEKGTLVVSLSESGQVSSSNTTPITTQVTGVINNVYVSEGDKVYQGQNIASITPDQTSAQKQASAYASYLGAQNSLNSAQAQINSLQSALFKANQTFVNGAGTINPVTDDPTYIEQRADWLQAEANYKNQALAISQAQASLNSASLTYQQLSSNIAAPISGTIENLSVSPNAIISGSSTNGSSANSTTSTSTNTSFQTIATITTGGNPVITVNLSEIDAPKISLGQKATITLDAFPVQTFTGKVSSINTTGSVSSGVTTYPANITLDTSFPKIYPNMSASANIIIDTRDNALLVPSTAVQTVNGQSIVRVLKNGQVTQIPVTVGVSSDTQIEIVSGLSEGDTVITSIITNQPAASGSSPFSGNRGLGGFGGGGGIGGNRGGTGR